MARFSAHEYLVNVAAFLSSNVVAGPGGVLPSAGVLLSSYHYEMKLPELEAFQTLLMGQRVPDICVVNTILETVLVIECKSGIDQEEQQFRLTDQIKFFLSDRFLDIAKSIYKSRTMEVVILTYQGSEDEIIRLIQSSFPNKNIIVWTIPSERREHSILKKVLGKHIDLELDRALEAPGIEFDPPVNDMLIDPTLSDRVLTCRILARLLAWHFRSGLVREEGEGTINVEEFRKVHKDWVRSDKRLKDIFRYLAILVPELGKFESDKESYILNSRPDRLAVREKEEILQKMSDEQFQTRLQIEHIAKAGLRIRRRRLKPSPAQAKLPWGS